MEYGEYVETMQRDLEDIKSNVEKIVEMCEYTVTSDTVVFSVITLLLLIHILVFKENFKIIAVVKKMSCDLIIIVIAIKITLFVQGFQTKC